MSKIVPLQVIKKSPPDAEGASPQRGNDKALKHGFWADLSRRNIDQRSKLAKAINSLEAALVTALGGDPSPQEVILIHRLTYKIARATLFEAADFAGEEPSGSDHYIALANSIRLDLTALGLERRAKKIPDLADYLKAATEGQAKAKE